MRLHGIDRTALQDHLTEHGIPSNIYYPVPVHKQKGFEGKFEQVGTLPNTMQLTEEVLSLPMHTEMDDKTLNYITNSIKEFVEA